MNINSWKNNTLTAFNNSQQQSFIQAWKASEKTQENTPYNQEEWKCAEISSKRSFGEEEANEEEKLREEMRNL